MKKVSIKLFNVLFLILSMSFAFTSCTNEANDKSNGQDGYTNVGAEAGKWFYYSFEQDKFVGEGKAGDASSDAEWKKRTDWDIAFHRDNIRTNSGTSGDGQGGMFMADTEDFDAVTAVPKGAEFVVDRAGEKINLTKKEKGQKEKWVEASLNILPNMWVHGELDVKDHHVHFVIDKKNVFVVRTAKGKYAKIQFEGFKSKQSRPDYFDIEYVDIRYAFQKDGSTKF